MDQTRAPPETEGGAMKPTKSWRERKNEREGRRMPAEERSSSPKALEDKMANSQHRGSTSDYESDHRGTRAKKGSYKDKYASHVQPQEEEEQNRDRERRIASKQAMQAKVEQQEQAYSRSENAPMTGDSLEDVAKQQAAAATVLQARFRGNRSRAYKASHSDKGARGGVKEADQAGGEIAKAGQAGCEVIQADQAAGENVGRTATSNSRRGKYQPKKRATQTSGQTQNAGDSGSVM
jgi:hypothetical protein